MLSLTCYEDNANVAYEWQESLRSVGVKANAYTRALHGFGYPEQATLLQTKKEFDKIYKETQYVIYMHSYYIEPPSDCNFKGSFVFHGGSLFRKRPDYFNSLFNPIVDASLIQTRDLFGLGAKNERWMFPSIDTAYFEPDFKSYRRKGKLRVCHYPSSIHKGSSKSIIPIVKELTDKGFIESDYTDGTVTFPYNIHLRMKAQCDIYIESLIPKETKCSEWGVSAMEAAALGKIVLTNFDGYYEYEKEFGYCPFFIISNPGDIEAYLYSLSELSDAEILSLKKRTRTWIEDMHSRKATGKRLVEKLNLK